MSKQSKCEFVPLERGTMARRRCVHCGFPTMPHAGPVRRRCSATDRDSRPYEPPNALQQVTNYQRAIRRWMKAGRPERSEAEALAIFEGHCQSCDMLNKGTCTHKECGCTVRGTSSTLVKIGHAMGVPAALTNKLRMATESCPLGKWSATVEVPPDPARWISDAGLVKYTNALLYKLPPDIDAVAGVTRSGMDPAAYLAKRLHVPLYEINKYVGIRPLGKGWRLGAGEPVDCAKHLLVVDDTVANGVSMRWIAGMVAKERLTRKVTTAAVLCSDEGLRIVDLYGEHLPNPHYLAWNFFNSVHSPVAALDMDGIICHDCPRDDDDDGPRYAKWLDEVRPLNLPRKEPVPLIVTARLEKYRKLTEAWLRRWGVRWNKLVMGTWATKDERSRNYNAGEYKGGVYKRSDCILFVESCPHQAEEIAKASGKRVICPAVERIWN